MTQLVIGDWYVDFNSGSCVRKNHSGPDQQHTMHRLEPKSCQLLQVLAEQPGQLVSKEQLVSRVWPESYATDDTLARTLSRLRTTLDDDARAPRYIETVPKRGYRLIADVSSATDLAASAIGPATLAKLTARRRPRLLLLAILLTLTIIAGLMAYLMLRPATPVISKPADSVAGKDLLTRADDYYHQMRLVDNEMAIALYQQHLELHPGAGLAYAGLANALVQKALRWSGEKTGEHSTLTAKVAAGTLADDASQQQLQRALSLAQQAVALQPDNATTLKALGFVLSAQGRYAEAINIYQQALQADPQAWQVHLNIGELYQATGDMLKAINAYEAAFNAMAERYPEQEVQIRPWIARVGSMIGDHYLAVADHQSAERWYRRVLSLAPLDEQATLGLVQVLHATGDSDGALQLCQQLNQRLQTSHACQPASGNQPLQ
ncbi:winged helix-turn-helix domain-containing protein [Arsukibacterium indicum]|uniref:Winged helix-turn-helix domain-containing protein n=1 Tax=Arsukibacterium indicum TaxID=2848612 RepID=A0ABS6MQ34_9GAMM|nr:winged helix-turn-helix domain-containing protein [Arsukibacterium indicum]MBV2130489.1 winged helix-turn-helix domain-containing protein [Arsukibacterium indicum]